MPPVPPTAPPPAGRRSRRSRRRAPRAIPIAELALLVAAFLPVVHFLVRPPES